MLINKMTKRTDIREGMKSIVYGHLPADMGFDLDVVAYNIADQILIFQHSQGVVLRVDEELPITCGYAQMTAARYSMDVTCPLFEAGYVNKVEPLIKEGE